MVDTSSMASVEALQKGLDVSAGSCAAIAVAAAVLALLPSSTSCAFSPGVFETHPGVLQDAVKQLLASGSPSIQGQIVPAITAALPQPASATEVCAASCTSSLQQQPCHLFDRQGLTSYGQQSSNTLFTTPPFRPCCLPGSPLSRTAW
jgi:hypothetical protein